MKRILTVCALELLFILAPAGGEVIYSYAGNDFTTGCTSCALDGYFTVSNLLADDLGGTSSGYAYITPDSFSFTNNDGLSITNVNEFQSTFSFKTDPEGNIVNWVIELTYNNSFGNNIVSSDCDICTIPSGSGVADSSYINGVPVGENDATPGTWSVIETPEPSMLLIAGAGLVGVILRRQPTPKRASGTCPWT